jgi:hypothetical protein
MEKRSLLPLLFLTALSVAGCANPDPVVSDYNGASVKITQTQVAALSDPTDPAIVNQAVRICATDGRKAEYASTVRNPNTSQATHLFLCLE